MSLLLNIMTRLKIQQSKKNNRVPGKDYLIRIEDRNKKIQLLNNTVIQTDFAGYSDDLIGRMWSYAKLSGIKEYRG